MKKIRLFILGISSCMIFISCTQITSQNFSSRQEENAQKPFVSESSCEDENARHIFHGGGSGDTVNTGSNDSSTIGILIPGNASSKPSPSKNPGSSKKGGR